MALNLAALQGVITNSLPSVDSECFAGIIGDRPSQSAKSPSIWNPVFKALDIPASYVPLDVEPQRLAELLGVLRGSAAYLGGNVTMPYKVAVMEHLDEIDPKARDIGAVNTVVRTIDGRLLGANTDGQGGLDSLTRPQPGSPEAAVPDLTGTKALMLGAGGAARALAFYLAEAIGADGHLHIANRNADRARELAGAADRRHHNCAAVESFELADYDLVINASTVGQAGIRRLPDGGVTCLEPFSPLAPADAPTLPTDIAAVPPTFYAQWMHSASEDVNRNNAASLDVLRRTPTQVVFFDIIFAPLETTLLRQARLTGHRTLNGKGMNVAQAVDGFFNRVCRRLLEQRNVWHRETYQKILSTMYAVW